MNSNVEILDDIDKVTIATRNDFNQKNLKIFFLSNGIGRNFKLLTESSCWPENSCAIPALYDGIFLLLYGYLAEDTQLSKISLCPRKLLLKTICDA